MDENKLPKLVEANQIKFDELKRIAMDGRIGIQRMFFDNRANILSIHLIKAKGDTVVHYVTDSCGLIYDNSTMEFIGIQIECL